MPSSPEGDLPYASARGLWACSASHFFHMRRRVLHGLLHSFAGFMDFHGAVYGRFRQAERMSPRSGGHIPESLHERALYSPNIWHRLARYLDNRITTMELPSALALLSHVWKKTQEMPNRDRALFMMSMWGPRRVPHVGRVDLRVVASASEPKARCRNHALHRADALPECL